MAWRREISAKYKNRVCEKKRAVAQKYLVWRAVIGRGEYKQNGMTVVAVLHLGQRQSMEQLEALDKPEQGL